MATHDVTITNGMVTSDAVRDPQSGSTITRMSTSAERNAAIGAAIARISETGPVTAEALAALDGKKVTLLLHGDTMLGSTVVVARPGTLFNGGTAILPKGKRTNGYRIDRSKLLAVFEGYDTAKAEALYQAADIGSVAELTPELLGALPTNSKTCSLAVVTTTALPGVRAEGCLWLLHSYSPGDDIAEGMLVVPAGASLSSEYGSIYGRDLIGRSSAVVLGANPISFSDAIELDNLADAYTALGM